MAVRIIENLSYESSFGNFLSAAPYGDVMVCSLVVQEAITLLSSRKTGWIGSHRNSITYNNHDGELSMLVLVFVE
jgi:hypothetical protein